MSEQNKNQLKKLQDDLIFEVACLGCGKTAFNLPYVIDSYSAVTCRECGEITIAQVLKEGGLAVSTKKQKDKAFAEYKKELISYLKQISKSYDATSKWKEAKDNYFAYYSFMGLAPINFSLEIKTEGLYIWTIIIINDIGSRISSANRALFDFSNFNNKLLLAEIEN